MANSEHLAILGQGVEVWNKWREENPEIIPDLEGANLMGADLRLTNLSRTKLGLARLNRANLYRANLSNADLHKARLREAGLNGANFNDANLSDANLNGANLTKANLTRANLSNASLHGTVLVRTNLEHAKLVNCSIHGISVWNVQLKDAVQANLAITGYGEPKITVDNLEVAQFIHLLLNNPKIRQVIDTITSKVVLILGRFTPERKVVLDALREELREHNYSPVVFDFEKPTSKDLTETVSTLAHMSRFIIADLTDPSSIPYELATIVPHCVVPVVPLLVDDETRQEFAMFKDLGRRYSWVLPIYRYTNQDMLLASIKDHIIQPAEEKARELEQKR